MIEEFCDTLQEKVLCTDDLNAGLKYRKKTDAINYRYLSLNQHYKHFISIDIDRPGSAYTFEDRNLPVPSWITVNRKNGHCHYLYQLNTPIIYTDNGRRKPQNLYEKIDFALTKALGGDPNYTGLITRNPLFQDSNTIHHSVRYDLEDFLEYINIGSANEIRKCEMYAGFGRNCTLFDKLRHWAYRVVGEFTSFETFRDSVEEQAELYANEFIAHPSGLVPTREVRTVAKSVAKWTWKNRSSIYQVGNNGIMDLPISMELSEKQKKGAEYAHAKKKENNFNMIAASAIYLKASGKNPTQNAISMQTGISVRTIRKHWSRILEKLNASK